LLIHAVSPNNLAVLIQRHLSFCLAPSARATD
jgi:hypothetical protein